MSGTPLLLVCVSLKLFFRLQEEWCCALSALWMVEACRKEFYGNHLYGAHQKLESPTSSSIFHQCSPNQSFVASAVVDRKRKTLSLMLAAIPRCDPMFGVSLALALAWAVAHWTDLISKKWTWRWRASRVVLVHEGNNCAHVNHFYEAPEIANQFVADTCLGGFERIFQITLCSHRLMVSLLKHFGSMCAAVMLDSAVVDQRVWPSLPC